MRRKETLKICDLINIVDNRLKRLAINLPAMILREKVICLADIVACQRSLGIAIVREAGCDSGNARERLCLYFLANVGIVLDCRELEVVGGISEYGRRIRELRVQDGYRILTGNSNDPEAGVTLSPTQYLLISGEGDSEAAHRWAMANRIRREDTSAQARILKFLQANVGKRVTSEELYYVAKTKEFGRRTRELRTEQGYPIATRFTGRPDLIAGEYVLESAERIFEPHDRKIPESILREVFERDNNSCQLCNWTVGKWTRADPRFLEVHHIQHHAEGGAATVQNLVVLCNKCHDQLHSGKLHLRTYLS